MTTQTPAIAPQTATEQELMDALDQLANEVAEATIKRIEYDYAEELEDNSYVGCYYESTHSDMSVLGEVKFYASVTGLPCPEVNYCGRKVNTAEVYDHELTIYDTDDCRDEFFKSWCNALVATADRIVNSRV